MVLARRQQSPLEFQTPFGITACLSRVRNRTLQVNSVVSNAFRHHCMFKVKCLIGNFGESRFQTPFGITACLRKPSSDNAGRDAEVSNAFRHHCMFKSTISSCILTFFFVSNAFRHHCMFKCPFTGIAFGRRISFKRLSASLHV